MIEIRKTDVFARWLDDLSDLRARARIQARIERLAAGNPGDVKPAGKGVSELRNRLRPRLSRVLQATRPEVGHPVGGRRQEFAGP